MSKMNIKSFFNPLSRVSLSLLLLFSANIMLRAGEINIIPKPASLKTGTGHFTLNKDTKITADTDLKDYAIYLSEVLSSPTGYDIEIAEIPEKAQIKLVIDSISGLQPEGYSLFVSPEEVLIKGADKGGLFYGIQTFMQLFPSEIYSERRMKGVDWSIPVIEITDAPNRPFRGMMLDLARYYMPIDYIKHMIDMMGMYKYNKLQLHLTDDSGWRLESEKYPLLTEKGAYAGTKGDRLGGYYTKDEMRDLIDYADFRNVEIIPEIEFPAHILSAIVAYPELSCTEEQLELPRKHFISRDILCVGKDSSLQFLYDILEETADLFPSKYINIGGDEAEYDRWEECEKCQALKVREGLKETSDLQGWLTDSVAKYMKKLDRTVIGWDEIIRRGEVETPVIALSWHEVADSTIVVNTPHKSILTPASHLYFDFPEYATEGEVQAATWLPPRNTQQVYEMPINDYSESSYVIGVQGCLWNDQFIHGEKLQNIDVIGENRSEAYLDYLAFPRMMALSELGWSKESDRNWPDFQDRLKHHYAKLDKVGTGYRVPEPILVSVTTDGPADSKIIVLEPSVEGSQIRYTTDGSYPTRHSAIYPDGGIVVSPETVIHASTLVGKERISLPLTVE